jgi:hypothetical protein
MIEKRSGAPISGEQWQIKPDTAIISAAAT